MLLTRCQLFHSPSVQEDNNFRKIMNGKLENVIQHYGIMDRVPFQALDLIQKIFQLEHKRISIEEVIKHPFVTNSSSFRHTYERNYHNECETYKLSYH